MRCGVIEGEEAVIVFSPSFSDEACDNIDYLHKQFNYSLVYPSRSPVPGLLDVIRLGDKIGDIVDCSDGVICGRVRETLDATGQR